AAGTLAVRAGLRAAVPSVDPRPRLTMDDMGHGDHGAMGHEAPAADPHAGHDMPAKPAAPPDPHAGHIMPPAKPAADPHAGHAMPAQRPLAPPDPHAGHDMSARTMQA